MPKGTTCRPVSVATCCSNSADTTTREPTERAARKPRIHANEIFLFWALPNAQPETSLKEPEMPFALLIIEALMTVRVARSKMASFTI